VAPTRSLDASPRVFACERAYAARAASEREYSSASAGDDDDDVDARLID
jgi:hypothetical protein